MTPEQIAKELRTDIDWISVFSLMHNIANQLNDRQRRFQKADMIETGIASYSQNVERVDSYSLDHLYKGQRIETKITTRTLCTRVLNQPKKVPKTGFIKLNNMYSVRKFGNMMPFDFLLIVDVRCAAITSFDRMKKHATFIGDGFKLDLPHSVLEWIIPVGEISMDDLIIKKNYNLTRRFDSVKTECIDEFRR